MQNWLYTFRLPDDIWLVDLDSNKLTPPSGEHEGIPALPEPEGTILKNHLKQVTKHHPFFTTHWKLVMRNIFFNLCAFHSNNKLFLKKKYKFWMDSWIIYALCVSSLCSLSFFSICETILHYLMIDDLFLFHLTRCILFALFSLGKTMKTKKNNHHTIFFMTKYYSLNFLMSNSHSLFNSNELCKKKI